MFPIFYELLLLGPYGDGRYYKLYSSFQCTRTDLSMPGIKQKNSFSSLNIWNSLPLSL